MLRKITRLGSRTQNIRVYRRKAIVVGDSSLCEEQGWP
jgi:hypothetical protein